MFLSLFVALAGAVVFLATPQTSLGGQVFSWVTDHHDGCGKRRGGGYYPDYRHEDHDKRSGKGYYRDHKKDEHHGREHRGRGHDKDKGKGKGRCD